MSWLTKNESDTRAFASALAPMLKAGDTVLLTGDLGTGKSVMARGIAHALGVIGAMPSPTFTLMIPYTGRLRVYHFDLYRLADPDEFYEAGLDEFIGGDGVALVEWPEMAELAPVPALTMELRRGSSDEERLIDITADGFDAFDTAPLENWKV